MRWGTRRARGKDGTVGSNSVHFQVNEHGQVAKTSGGHGRSASIDANKALAYKQIAKSSGTHALSNPELQHLVNRMNLEQNYSRLTSDEKVSANAK